MYDVFQTFLRFQRRSERFLGRKIVSVKTDEGLEFCNKDIDNFLEQQGINHQKINTYTPEQNGVAERYNLTAIDGIKALLKSSGAAQKFWVYFASRILGTGFVTKTVIKLLSKNIQVKSHRYRILNLLAV
ncbi:hypothetical protein AVEN_255155-1 [Araneus ventricosus]|uniref:Integrase catalytic domain-containing protein n=1 Tax=Araneus ventricosus TaxID=182803 RepID=A0A4Y2BCZ5_ARAVE|nr:hypothetical protein AVEN_255155-1 [Araneus ventricosus]